MMAALFLMGENRDLAVELPDFDVVAVDVVARTLDGLLVAGGVDNLEIREVPVVIDEGRRGNLA
jgi:hypothetical protein